MAANRVYVVESDEEMTLVAANNPSQALSHVVKGKYQIRPASAIDVVDYVRAGGVVEDSTEKAESVESVVEPVAEEN